MTQIPLDILKLWLHFDVVNYTSVEQNLYKDRQTPAGALRVTSDILPDEFDVTCVYVFELTSLFSTF